MTKKLHFCLATQYEFLKQHTLNGRKCLHFKHLSSSSSLFLLRVSMTVFNEKILKTTSPKNVQTVVCSQGSSQVESAVHQKTFDHQVVLERLQEAKGTGFD